MATMNVSLPDEMKAWVDERVASGDYAGASDVVRDLIRSEQSRLAAVAEFQSIIDEAEASGTRTRTKEQVKAAVLEERRALA